jgi:hypothetical protein
MFSNRIIRVSATGSSDNVEIAVSIEIHGLRVDGPDDFCEFVFTQDLAVQG